MRFARFTAADLERRLVQIRQALPEVEHDASNSAGDRVKCAAPWVQFAKLFPESLGYLITDLRGNVRCSGSGPGELAAPRLAKWALPQQPSVRAVHLGDTEAAFGKEDWVVPLTFWLTDSKGETSGAIVVLLNSGNLNPFVGVAALPLGTAAGLVDGAGRIVADLQRGPVRPGSSVWPAAVLRALKERPQTTQTYVDETGVSRAIAFAPVAGTTWVAFASLSVEGAVARAWERAAFAGSLAILGLAFTIAGVFTFRRKVVLPLRRATLAIDRGRSPLQERGIEPGWPKDIDNLLASIERQQARLTDERLRRDVAEGLVSELLDEGIVWHWVQDAEFRFVAIEGPAAQLPHLKRNLGKQRWEIPGYLPIDGDWAAHRAKLQRHEPFSGLVMRDLQSEDAPRYYRVSGSPRFDEAGGFQGYRGIAADVTKDYLARQTLLRSERRYRAIFDSHHRANLLLDPATGKILEASRGAAELLDFTPLALSHLLVDELGLRASDAKASLLAVLAGAGQAPVLLRRLGAKGEWVFLDALAGPIQDGENQLLFVSLHDVTERQRAQATARKLVRAVENTPTSIVITDRQGNIEYVNPWFEALTGFHREEVIGQNPRIFQSGQTPPRVYAELWQTITKGGVWHGELCNRAKDGRLFWESAAIAPVLDEGGAITHFVAVKEDITQRKAIEEERRQLGEELEQRVAERTEELAQINRELDAFSYSVSHDLRAPLRAIAGFTQLIEQTEAAKLSPRASELFQRVQRNATRMSELIEDLLRLARVGRASLHWADIDLHEIAQEVIREQSAAYPVTRIELDALPRARCDSGLMRQVFANLIGNALKYSAKTESPQVEIGFCEGRYFIRDNGTGFDPQYTGQLFEPFRRLHADADFPGTGIGLAIVRRIIERHQGRIWAEASPGAGATFNFTLGVPP